MLALVATGKVALVGDAAHAIVPFYGQGANASMEDCIEIVRCLDEAGNWTTALAEYQKRRKENADAIANYALQNFIEMRDTVNSKTFQLEDAVQHALERRSGGRYVSRYELVYLTTVPVLADQAAATRNRTGSWRASALPPPLWWSA